MRTSNGHGCDYQRGCDLMFLGNNTPLAQRILKYSKLLPNPRLRSEPRNNSKKQINKAHKHRGQLLSSNIWRSSTCFIGPGMAKPLRIIRTGAWYHTAFLPVTPASRPLLPFFPAVRSPSSTRYYS